MTTGNFTFNGWTTSSITPKAGQVEKVMAGTRPAVDRSLASRVVAKPATEPVAKPGSILDKLITKVEAKGVTGSSPATDAQALQKTQSTVLKDPSLGSRVLTPGTSAVGTVPDFIAAASNQLEGTSQIQTAQQELLDKILKQIASVGQPAATPTVISGGGGGGYDPVKKAEQDAKFRMADLERQKALLGETKFGQYAGSPQESIDQELYNLYKNKAVDPATKNPSTTWGKSAWVSAPQIW